MSGPSHLNKFREESGSAIIVSLIMLVILTVIGVAATNTSILETMMSVAERQRQQSFYAAESGIQHVKGLLLTQFVSKNAAKIAAGSNPDWDFALTGATDTDFEGGRTWISNGDAGHGYTYTVIVWNNNDSGNATNDTDGLIYARSTGTGVNGSSASVEVIMRGWVESSGSVGGYSAQAGAGAGKSYTSDDMNAISDFTQQL